MNKLIHFTFKYLWIIREYTDSKGNKLYKFNLWNPLGYVALTIVATINGIVEGIRTSWILIRETFKDAVS
jgi:hypothetical protein